MDLTYKVLGADGKAYGPATLAEINAWLREGRITGDTQVTRSDIDYWTTASNFSELALPRTATAAPLASAISSTPTGACLCSDAEPRLRP